MAKKSCRYCGIVPFNHVCPVVTKEKNARDAKREDKSIYWCSKWRKLRADVLDYQDHVCLWSLYVEGIVREARTCHHIVTLMDDDTKAYDIDNVIGMEKHTHDRVHELYKINKKATMKLLRECMKLWDDGIKTEGLGILRDKLKNIDTPPL